jgi:hypothetical protein
MIFPKNHPVYENLNTSFTDVSELLVNLEENGFTGVLEVVFWEYEGLLLMDNGSVVNGIEEYEDQTFTGSAAVKRVVAKSQEKDGAINVYRVNGEMVTMLSSIARSENVYRDLSTEFTSLEGLINKLSSEDHTGYIEVHLQGDQTTGFIFMLAGKVIDSLFTAGGEDITGQHMLPRIIEQASLQGATFNVYRAALEEAIEESEDIMVSFDFPQQIELWARILAEAETVADRATRPGHFLNTFKDALIANAEDYPFLDPFAALFQYQDGEITFEAEPRKEFSQGVAAGLQETLRRLEEDYPEEQIYDKVRARLGPIQERKGEQIRKFRLDRMLPGLFG